MTNVLSNVDLATALSKLSAEDRAYVDRVANDLRPARRRRRRRTTARASAPAKATKPSAETPKPARKKKKAKKASGGLIAGT